MLNDASGFSKIYLAVGYTDLRKGIDGLAGIVRQQFQLDPFQKNVVFLLKKFRHECFRLTHLMGLALIALV